MNALSRNPLPTKLFRNASAEFRLVALCCQWPPRTMHTEHLNALLQMPLHWANVQKLAVRHRVQGLVHTALTERAEVPGATRARLAVQAAAIIRSNLTATATLARLQQCLQEESLRFVVLKGLPLAQLAYGNPSIRHSKDIDILIAPEDLPRAEQVLHELGFRRTVLTADLTPDQTKVYQRFRQHHDFVQVETGIRLELHWRAFENAHLVQTGTAEPERIDLGGGLRVPALPVDELLLNLCLHGAGHAWFRLKWIADVAALLSKTPSGTADKLLRSARERDLDRPVEQALLLCEGLFPGTCFSATAKPTRAGEWLARVAASALLEEATAAPSSHTDYVAPGLKRSRLMLRRSWRYRLEEIQLRATSPIDWRTCALPRSLHSLYPLLRLPLWIHRRWFAHARKRLPAQREF